jgi:hypothetical protein
MAQGQKKEAENGRSRGKREETAQKRSQRQFTDETESTVKRGDVP